MTDLKQTLLQTINELSNNPARGQLVFRANTKWIDGVRCSAKVRHFDEVYVDEPAALGGDDRYMNPVELILAALGTCQEIMYAAYASVMDIDLDGINVDVKGNLDIQGLLGLDDNVPAGFSSISYVTNITSAAPNEKIEKLVQQVESHCPVLDILTRPINVTGKILHNSKEMITAAV